MIYERNGCAFVAPNDTSYRLAALTATRHDSYTSNGSRRRRIPNLIARSLLDLLGAGEEIRKSPSLKNGRGIGGLCLGEK